MHGYPGERDRGKRAFIAVVAFLVAILANTIPRFFFVLKKPA